MIKKILKILANVFLLVLFLVGLLFLVSLFPTKNNLKILSVMSGSMEPTIKTGSLILIKPAETYQINDIITFKTPLGKDAKDFTTHRINAVDSVKYPAVYVTKGDANSTPDGWRVSNIDIIGKHYVTVPYLGYLITYIKTLPGLIILIIIPAIIIVYEEIRKIHHEAKEILKKRRTNKSSTQNIESNSSKKLIANKSRRSGRDPDKSASSGLKPKDGKGKHASKIKKDN